MTNQSTLLYKIPIKRFLDHHAFSRLVMTPILSLRARINTLVKIFSNTVIKTVIKGAAIHTFKKDDVE